MAGYSHSTAQPPTLAAFRPWEGSAGAGRVRPAGRKDNSLNHFSKTIFEIAHLIFELVQ